MKTIAQQINWDFDANGTLVILNKNGKQIYWERFNGQWAKLKWDFNGNEIYFEDSGEFWEKREYDSEGNEIYYKNSNGIIIDSRPKPSEDKVIEIEGVKYKLIEL